MWSKILRNSKYSKIYIHIVLLFQKVAGKNVPYDKNTKAKVDVIIQWQTSANIVLRLMKNLKILNFKFQIFHKEMLSWIYMNEIYSCSNLYLLKYISYGFAIDTLSEFQNGLQNAKIIHFWINFIRLHNLTFRAFRDTLCRLYVKKLAFQKHDVIQVALKKTNKRTIFKQFWNLLVFSWIHSIEISC